MIRIIFLLFTILPIIGCYTDSEAARPIGVHKSFEMNHDITWINQPDNLPLTPLLSFNLAPKSSVYWDSDSDKMVDDPSESATKKFVMSFDYGKKMYLNIEHLPYQYAQTTEVQQLDTVRKLSMILHWAKTQRPDIDIGIFSMTVEKGFFTLDNAPQEYLDRNKRFKALAEYSDVIYLNMYTWWVDRHDKWIEALNTSVQQARLANKKIIVFLWPHHQQPSTGQPLIPGREWRSQLEKVYKLTDGIIIWDKKTCDWQDINCADATDPNNWWYQTLDFMQQKGLK